MNKKAGFDYDFIEKFEAGLVLKGYEVKSVKAGHASLKGAFVTFRKTELYLTNAHINPYQQAGNQEKYDPTTPRKLLVKKSELKRLIGKARTEGLTLVPINYILSVVNQAGIRNWQRKKKYDRREDIKKKDIERRTRTLTKRR